jgi:hypothetical protein
MNFIFFIMAKCPVCFMGIKTFPQYRFGTQKNQEGKPSLSGTESDPVVCLDVS